MTYISMQPVTVARILKRQPFLFEGHVNDLGMRNLKPETLARPDLSEIAERVLLRKFNNAARGVLLRALLDRKMYDLPEALCRYHPVFEDRWDPEENAVVEYTVLPPDEAAAVRLDIIQATKFLCDGTQNYERLLAAFQAHASDSGRRRTPSLEELEDRLVNRTVEKLEETLKLDLQTGYLSEAPRLPDLEQD